MAPIIHPRFVISANKNRPLPPPSPTSLVPLSCLVFHRDSAQQTRYICRPFCCRCCAPHTSPTTTCQGQASHHHHHHHHLQHTRRASSPATGTPHLFTVMHINIVALVTLGLVCGSNAAAPTFSCFNPPPTKARPTPSARAWRTPWRPRVLRSAHRRKVSEQS